VLRDGPIVIAAVPGEQLRKVTDAEEAEPSLTQMCILPRLPPSGPLLLPPLLGPPSRTHPLHLLLPLPLQLECRLPPRLIVPLPPLFGPMVIAVGRGAQGQTIQTLVRTCLLLRRVPRLSMRTPKSCATPEVGEAPLALGLWQARERSFTPLQGVGGNLARRSTLPAAPPI